MRNFTKFSCSSTKARIAWAQERLTEKGYFGI